MSHGLLNEYDLYLLGEGNLHRSYDLLGAHVRASPPRGVRFAVWAPHARRVSVAGDFNGWDGSRSPMHREGGFGVWAAFVPGAGPGDRYVYRLETADGRWIDKADPYAFASEAPPRTASVVAGSRFAWSDGNWIASRDRREAAREPLSIYELHAGSWRRRDGRWLTYRELAVELVDYVKPLGYTHVELLPICEHPLDRSWGYQVTGYYAPTARYGAPGDFAWLVDYCHRNGIGVILDWVPAHFPRDAHGLARFDGSALYEYEDTRKGEHREWGTLVFNYGRNEVRNFLVSSALFWLDRYHVDGLRVDAVAAMLYLDFGRTEWEPNERGTNENLAAIAFLRELNRVCRQYHPGALLIAEDSSLHPGVTRTVEEGGLGFTFKWNMGWMNDTLRYFRTDPLYRKYHHELLLLGLREGFRERYVLPISHDEVVHLKRSLFSKMPGDEWRQYAGLRLFLAHMWAHPGKKLLFMGQEFGVRAEWSEEGELEWGLLEREPNRGIQRLVAELNRLYRDEPALHERDPDPTSLVLLEAEDRDRSVLAYLRRGTNSDDDLVVVCNFTPVPRPDYRIGVPRAGTYRELLNTDEERWGGSGVRSGAPVEAEPMPVHGQQWSIAITLPPLAALLLDRRATAVGSPARLSAGEV